MKPGDTFICPTGPQDRFPEREMRVRSGRIVDGTTWVDAYPIRLRDGDEVFHSTFKLGDDGQAEPV